VNGVESTKRRRTSDIDAKESRRCLEDLIRSAQLTHVTLESARCSLSAVVDPVGAAVDLGLADRQRQRLRRSSAHERLA
jgi:hypothetical protein